ADEVSSAVREPDTVRVPSEPSSGTPRPESLVVVLTRGPGGAFSSVTSSDSQVAELEVHEPVPETRELPTPDVLSDTSDPSKHQEVADSTQMLLTQCAGKSPESGSG